LEDVAVGASFDFTFPFKLRREANGQDSSLFLLYRTIKRAASRSTRARINAKTPTMYKLVLTGGGVKDGAGEAEVAGAVEDDGEEEGAGEEGDGDGEFVGEGEEDGEAEGDGDGDAAAGVTAG